MKQSGITVRADLRNNRWIGGKQKATGIKAKENNRDKQIDSKELDFMERQKLHRLYVV